MQESDRKAHNKRCRLIRAETVLLGLFAATLLCAVPARAADDDDEGGSWSDSIGDTVKNAFSGVGKSMGMDKPPPPPQAESPSGCPSITILDGTAGSRVSVAGGAGNQGVRYQFSIGHVGRQCSMGGGRVSIKVAADGRVLLGPAGSAGRFDVPIRVVVFSEAQQKPIASKLYKVAASLPAGQASGPFQFVSDDIVVPTSGSPAAEYSIKVGLDGSGKGGPEPATKKRHKSKPVASASAQ